MEFKPVWELQTERWLLVEYEKQPNTLTLTVSLSAIVEDESGESFSLHFGSLGVDRSVLEEADKDFLDQLFMVVAVVANANNWNVSISSLWSNLPYCIPDPDDYDEFEDESDRIFLEKALQFIDDVNARTDAKSA